MEPAVTLWKTVIVENQQLFRDLLARVLSLDPRFSVIATCDDAARAKELCADLAPDLLIAEPDLPSRRGLELLEDVVRGSAGTRVLALSQCTEPWMLRRMFEIGVHGFVEKSETLETLQNAAVEVAMGRNYFTAPFFRIQEQLRLEPEATTWRLSQTEQMILRLIAAGLTSRAIAQRLNLTLRSVESYRYRMMRKLGTGGAVGLLRFALQVPLGNGGALDNGSPSNNGSSHENGSCDPQLVSEAAHS
jgi:two-component system, NarL family, invasion response regulator UvrY